MFKISTLVGLVAFAGLQIPSAAWSQDFPKKQPIKIIVAANAGGTTDTMARISAEFLQKRLGQTVVVENKPGASSTIGADFVYRSAPDGYTLYMAGGELAVVPATRLNLPYKFSEFTFLVRAFNFHPLLIAAPKAPYNSTPELVAYMKANPGKVRYGTTGIAAIGHLGSAMFESAAGVKGLHVPYNGIAPVYQDLLAGVIDINNGAGIPLPDGLRVIGSVGTKRNPAFPNAPTLEEHGIKGASWDVWFGFVAPPNLPKPVADKLIAEITAMLKDPEALAKFLSLSKTAPETEPLTGDAFKKQVLEDHRTWKTVVEREKIVLQ